jgi:enoyl-[acyl-carrier protein] reductase III
MNIFGVHLDTRATLGPGPSRSSRILRRAGRRAVFFNTNAADARKREQVLDRIQEVLSQDTEKSIHFVLHSLAFGSLLPFISDDPQGAITEEQMDMTLRVMAHSLVYCHPTPGGCAATPSPLPPRRERGATVLSVKLV